MFLFGISICVTVICLILKIRSSVFYMIIVIGGTGFIGKHLIVALNKHEIEHVSFSRNPDVDFPKKHAPATKVDRISSLLAEENIQYIEKASLVVYLASSSTPASRMNSPQLEIENSIKPAIQTIADIHSVNPNAQILFMSSGGTVYGDGHTQPIPENALLKPSTPYAYSKHSIEGYLQYLNNADACNYTILRTSNPVGKWHKNPRQGFIGASINRIIESQALTIFGDGNAIRDYIDADEVADAIIEIYRNPTISKNKIWNVGSGIGTSLNDIVSILKSITGKEFNVNYTETRQTDLAYNVLDCRQIKEELGWHAKRSINEIIQDAWEQAHSP